MTAAGAAIVVTFGRVPLFFYLLHIPLINGLRVAYDYHRYGHSPLLEMGIWWMDPKKLPEDYSLSFPWVYLIWIGVVLLLYFPCRWFGALKRRWPGGLLSYL